MSSHHIVRDEQEPALLLLDPFPDKEIVSNLLEWSPTVITSVDLVEKFISFGFKVDVVLCPKERMDEQNQLLIHHSPIQLLSYDDGASLIHTSIYYLRARRHSALSVVAPKVDDTILNMYNELEGTFKLIFFRSNFKWYRCPGTSFKKWVPKTKVFRVLSTSGLEVRMNSIAIGLNNDQIICEDEGSLEIKSSGSFWLGERIK